MISKILDRPIKTHLLFNRPGRRQRKNTWYGTFRPLPIVLKVAALRKFRSWIAKEDPENG